MKIDMKRIKLILLFVIGISICNIFSQELTNGPQRELYLKKSNFPEYSYSNFFTVDNYLNSLTVIWDKDLDNNFISICNDCPAISFVTIDNHLKW